MCSLLMVLVAVTPVMMAVVVVVQIMILVETVIWLHHARQ